MNNSKEVGCTPDDNNDRRLPGSVQHEAQRGDSAYGTNNYAKPTPLDTKNTAGVIGQPHIGGDYAFNSLAKGAGDTSGAHGRVETTASNENLSAKYKYPNVHEDVTPLGRNQYNDHT